MDSGGARRGIRHKLTADTAMYPGSGPSGVEVKPLRPASLFVYQWWFWLQGCSWSCVAREGRKPFLACSTREMKMGERESDRGKTRLSEALGSLYISSAPGYKPYSAGWLVAGWLEAVRLAS